MVMESSQDPMAIAAADLLNRYGFDVGAFSAEQLVGYWLRSYPAIWVRAAVVEALYQGRYKSVSVGQILAIWKRRGQPIYHYGFEFERMVCGHLSRIPTQEVGAEPPGVTPEPAPTESSPQPSPPEPEPIQPEPLGLEETPLLSPVVAEDGPFPLGEEAIAPPLPVPDPAIPTFEWITPQNGEWPPASEGGPHPIDQFVPDPEISMFYEKLRAVAQDQQN